METIMVTVKRKPDGTDAVYLQGNWPEEVAISDYLLDAGDCPNLAWQGNELEITFDNARARYRVETFDYLRWCYILRKISGEVWVIAEPRLR